MIAVLYYLSQALVALAVALLAPAAVAFATGERDSGFVFVATAAVTAFVSVAAILALHGRTRALKRMETYVLAVAIWSVPPLIATAPLMAISGSGFDTALFEAVSGYTTTGATAMPSVESLGYAGKFFRAELQWLGGLVTLVTIVMVIAPSGLGGVTSSHVALVAGTERRGGRLGGTIVVLLGGYSAITLACIVLLLGGSIPDFDALCLALSTVSTGGFMPIDGDLSEYGSPYSDAVIAVFLLIGATSVVWHRMITEGRWASALRYRESYWVIGAAIGVGLIYAICLYLNAWSADQGRPIEAVADGLFSGISLVSTGGFKTNEIGFAAIPLPLAIFVALIGGGAISTAGGIKYHRLAAMLSLTGAELRRLVYPRSVAGHRANAAIYDPELMKSIWSSLIVALLVISGATLLLSLWMPTFESAVTAVVAAFSNVGQVYSSSWEGTIHWPTYAEFAPGARVVMVLTMILGRIEVLILLGTLNMAYWRS